MILIYFIDFYTAVNNHWILKAQDLRNLTTLSVAGGFRDYQVRSGLAFLPRLSQHDSALSVVVKKHTVFLVLHGIMLDSYLCNACISVYMGSIV